MDLQKSGAAADFVIRSLKIQYEQFARRFQSKFRDRDRAVEPLVVKATTYELSSLLLRNENPIWLSKAESFHLVFAWLKRQNIQVSKEWFLP